MVCYVIPFAILGQAATNNPLAPFDPVVGSFPNTKAEFWKWGISVITPCIVFFLGKVPALPRPVLPVITPLLGIALGLILRKLGQLNLGWVDMAQAGAVAVFLRESVNQLVTKQLKSPANSETSAKPVAGPAS